MNAGHGNEGILPLKTSTGLITAVMHEASRILARDWFTPDVTYRLTDLWTTHDAESFYTGRDYQIMIMPYYTLSKDTRKLVAAKLQGLANKPAGLDMLDPSLDANNKSEVANAAVVFVTKPWIRSAEDDRNGRVRSQIVSAVGLAKFEVDDPDWHKQLLDRRKVRKQALQSDGQQLA